MREQQRDEAGTEGLGAIAATAMAIVILIAIVVLFVVFKFNLFDGTTANDVHGSLPSASFRSMS